jgi:hypothetical protein
LLVLAGAILILAPEVHHLAHIMYQRYQLHPVGLTGFACTFSSLYQVLYIG